MGLSKQRLDEIGHALLIVMLTRLKLRFNPEHFKRQLGNLPQARKFLPEAFQTFTKEELKEAFETFSHELVSYSFNFDFSENGERKKRKEKRKRS